MRKIQVQIDGDVAHCPELHVTVVGDNPEDALRKLTGLIRKAVTEPVAILLPYLGQSFMPAWYDVKPKDPSTRDDFEDDQRIGNNLNKFEEE